MIKKEWAKQISATTKENQADVLFDEMLRERAAVLSRAGFAVEDALARLSKIEKNMQNLIDELNSLRDNLPTDRPRRDEPLIFQEINACVDEYNEARAKAELKFYYLIVTREAMGLRRHETVKQIYAIPPKKKRLQVF
jgi:vacuolar-type H+-ATPase subunit E/Vma4